MGAFRKINYGVRKLFHHIFSKWLPFWFYDVLPKSLGFFHWVINGCVKYEYDMIIYVTVTHFNFRYGSSLGRYPYTVKIWIWLNRPQGNFKDQKGQIRLIFHLEAILFKHCSIILSRLKLPKEDTNELPKDDWFNISEGHFFEGPKKVKG